MKLEEALHNIKPLDINLMNSAKHRFLSIAKPIKGLGLLEENFIKICGIQKTKNADIGKKCVVLMCADNGVVKQGVTQTGQEVTAVVASQFAERKTIVCKMCEISGADIFPVDIGIASDVDCDGVINKKVMYGTNDISEEPAMSREQAVEAIEHGINIVYNLKSKGYNLIAAGEMGIGNTTTSSACISFILNQNPELVTGKGAGLSDEALIKKIDVIKKAIKINKPDINDGIDILAKIGGLDIAGIVGLYIGCAAYDIPVVIDGLITYAAALIAKMIAPSSLDYLIASHCSDEPAAKLVLDSIDLKPLLFAEMCLGEGTGAAAVLPLFDMIQKIYYDMPSFSDMNIEAYKPFD